jgi:hypothetical protein
MRRFQHAAGRQSAGVDLEFPTLIDAPDVVADVGVVQLQIPFG